MARTKRGIEREAEEGKAAERRKKSSNKSERGKVPEAKGEVEKYQSREIPVCFRDGGITGS